VRLDVYLEPGTPEARRDEIRAAFAAEGLSIDYEGEASLKFSESVDPARIDVVLFLLGAAVEGLVFEAEKSAFKRAIAVLRRLRASGTVHVYRAQEPVDYLLPGGLEGDEALAAIEEDSDAPPGRRFWVRGAGWVAEVDLEQAMRDYYDRNARSAPSD
jgi:hypothetical protein